MTRRAALAVAAAVVAPVALVVVPAAAAKSYTLPNADVRVVVEPDGALDVTEQIEFAFEGPFTGAFREVPLPSGRRIDRIGVSERGVTYRPGASAELGSSGAPGTYGTKKTGKGERIVWHYSALDENRTFTIHYRLSGQTVAYDDVADVNLKVWATSGRSGSTT